MVCWGQKNAREKQFFRDSLGKLILTKKRPGLVGCPGGTTDTARRRGPTAAQHGEFDLLRVRPGPGPPLLRQPGPPGLPREPHVDARPSADARSTQSCSPEPPGIHDPPASASRETGITGARHRARREELRRRGPGGCCRRLYGATRHHPSGDFFALPLPPPATLLEEADGTETMRRRKLWQSYE